MYVISQILHKNMLDLEFKILLEKTTKETRTTQRKKKTKQNIKKKTKEEETTQKKNWKKTLDIKHKKRGKKPKEKNLALKKKKKTLGWKVEVQILNTPSSRTCTYKGGGGSTQLNNNL